MDRVGLVTAMLAVLAFPGGVYAGLAAALVSAAGRQGRRPVPAWGPAAIAGTALCGLAAALLPLPGSPASILPQGGAAANLAALAVLLAGGVALLEDGEAATVRLVAAAVVAAPLLALCAAASSLSAALVAGLPGAHEPAARVLAGGALVLAGPIAVGATRPGPRTPRALALGVVLLLAAAVAEPNGLEGGLAIAGVLAGLVVAGGGAALGAVLRPHAVPTLIAAGALAAAATALALAGA